LPSLLGQKTKRQVAALRAAPLIFHWEGSNKIDYGYKDKFLKTQSAVDKK